MCFAKVLVIFQIRNRNYLYLTVIDISFLYNPVIEQLLICNTLTNKYFKLDLPILILFFYTEKYCYYSLKNTIISISISFSAYFLIKWL